MKKFYALFLLALLAFISPAEASLRDCNGAGTECDAAAPGYFANAYFAPAPWVTTTASPSAACTADRLYMYSFYVPRKMVVDRLAISVTTAGTTSAVKMAIYTNPWDAVVYRLTDANPTGVATTSLGNVEITLAAAVTLSPGWYGAATLCTGSTHRFIAVQSAAANAGLQGGYSSLANIGASHPTGLFYDTAYSGGFPDTLTTMTVLTASSMPVVFPRINSYQ